jgi:hypothetical protein
VLWNKESLLDQCLKAGPDPRAAIVTAEKLSVVELAKKNDQSNIYKKLVKQLLQSRFKIFLPIFVSQKPQQNFRDFLSREFLVAFCGNSASKLAF